jgi:hypothetical protein
MIDLDVAWYKPVENTILSLSLVIDEPIVSVSSLQDIIAIAVIAIAVNNLSFMYRCFGLYFSYLASSA